jgi:hypothetical protein
MKLQDVLTVFDYNHRAKERLLAAAAKLNTEQFLAPAAFPFGGLRGGTACTTWSITGHSTAAKLPRSWRTSASRREIWISQYS